MDLEGKGVPRSSVPCVPAPASPQPRCPSSHPNVPQSLIPPPPLEDQVPGSCLVSYFHHPLLISLNSKYSFLSPKDLFSFFFFHSVGSQEALGLKTQEGSAVAWRRARLLGAVGDRSRRLDWDQLWTLFLASSLGGVEAKSHRMCLWPGRELESSVPLLGGGDIHKEAVCRTM